MCEFSHEGSKLVKLKKSEALDGHRFWIYNWKDKTLKSLNREFYFTKAITVGDKPSIGDSLGLYSYNCNYYYYYNCNYNNNYNYNNYYYYYNNNYNYNYNYNYNNYYYYYYNYNYNYNYYHIAGQIKSYDTTVIHDKGQRSKKIEIKQFWTLKDHKNKEFLAHFNDKVKELAKTFKVSTVDFQHGDKELPKLIKP